MTLSDALDVAIQDMRASRWGEVGDGSSAEAARVLTRFRDVGLGEIEKVAAESSMEAEGCADCANPDDPFTRAVGAKFNEYGIRLRTAIDDGGGEK